MDATRTVASVANSSDPGRCTAGLARRPSVGVCPTGTFPKVLGLRSYKIAYSRDRFSTFLATFTLLSSRLLNIVPITKDGAAVLEGARCPRCRCGCENYVHAVSFRHWGKWHLRMHCPCCGNTWMERSPDSSSSIS